MIGWFRSISILCGLSFKFKDQISGSDLPQFAPRQQQTHPRVQHKIQPLPSSRAQTTRKFYTLRLPGARRPKAVVIRRRYCLAGSYFSYCLGPKNTRQTEGGQVAAGTQHLPLGRDNFFWQLETGSPESESFC
jgi:hypothetical protein